jgi:preprotein translocase subunit YajC
MKMAASWPASGKSTWKDAPVMGNIVLAASSTKPDSFNPTDLLIILVVILGFYMLMIRPQQRRRQQVQQQQNTVRPGARVRTTAGMYATVVTVDGDDVILEVAPGIEVRYMKRAIMEVVSPGEEPEGVEDTEPEDAEDEYTEYTEDTEPEGTEDGYAEDEEEDEEDERPAAETAESGSTAKD